MRLDVVLEAFLPHSVDAVWSALTSADSISEWLMSTSDFEARVGSRFTLQTQHLSPTGRVEGEVRELDPPRRMVWGWTPGIGAAPTTVTFELTPEASGTRLRLTHVGEIDSVIGGLLQDGWPGRIELLRRRLD